MDAPIRKPVISDEPPPRRAKSVRNPLLTLLLLCLIALLVGAALGGILSA